MGELYIMPLLMDFRYYRFGETHTYLYHNAAIHVCEQNITLVHII